jgi:small ligand-binding sensory domain FIST
MQIGAGVSTAAQAADAAVEAAREAAHALGSREASVAFLFLSPAHRERVAEAALALREELLPERLLGCVAQGVVGGEREVEEGPAAAVWAATMPGAEVTGFHVTEPDDLPPTDEASLVALLVDPFTFPVAAALAALNDRTPCPPVVGGIAAGAGRPGTQALLLDDELYEHGAVGAVFSGVPVLAVVSQGCAPIGRDTVITNADANVVFELAGEPALVRLQREIAALSPEERRLAAEGLLAGLVIDENKAEYGRGDYLMRGILGADERAGSLVLGEQVRVGQTLRFHVRDPLSADEDLREALRREIGSEHVAGALLFTCNGRGTRMFAEPDHDARTVAEELRCDALAGFFCGGEIGPVGGRAFLHGFTATLAVFLES